VSAPRLAMLAAVLALAGCGDDPEPPRSSATQAPEATAAPSATATPRARRGLARPRCPADVPDCRSVSGRIVYVERVDPDGDGDLHVVVDAGSVTIAGMTAIDVAPELRPKRDPRVGDRVSAAGPVQTGSYGQSQIHALEFNVRRR
jgi:hypothetical protein